ncbi:hypothetical protein BGX34_003557 [Mortierella sp. NVP85]|nr:hypothetical protein BGX34_003557 [Mortierella sp. NVP85]
MGANPFFSSYDVGTESWQMLSTVKAPYTYLEGHSAVSDPHTGLVYIVGGYGNSTYNLLSVYDPKTKALVSQASATAATSLTDIGAVWLNSRNTILTFGGTRATPAVPQGLGSAELNEYDPSSKTWSTMSTSGDVPPARLDHCMVATEDGSKVVVFGGTPGGDDFFNTIYILDVKSGKWKQGESAVVSRTRMACALHSFQFIAWGGSSGSSRTTMLNNLPVVYNLNSNKWTDSYNASEKAKDNSVVIIVGVVVAIVVILVGIGLVLMKRRQKKKAQEAYNSDALTAAAISSRENVLHESNIKVAVENQKGYGNEYPMNQMGGGGGHGGLEKQQQGYGAAAKMQTPQAAYHSPMDPNPFVSPDDFVPPPPSLHYQTTPSSPQHPYASSYSAKSSPYYSTSSTRTDPFQQGLYSPAYSQTTTYYGQQSPAPGARSPQVIPDSTTHDDSQSERTSKGYVPPPPM